MHKINLYIYIYKKKKFVLLRLDSDILIFRHFYNTIYLSA